jgi:hypothetical protein
MIRAGYVTDDTDQCLFDLDTVQSTAALVADTQGAELLALNGRDGRRILIDLF